MLIPSWICDWFQVYAIFGATLPSAEEGARVGGYATLETQLTPRSEPASGVIIGPNVQLRPSVVWAVYSPLPPPCHASHRRPPPEPREGRQGVYQLELMTYWFE